MEQDFNKNLKTLYHSNHTTINTENIMKYAIWNNKGGVGKTFLTFSIASEYALLHEDKKVVVIDMCPQANISEILLGGGKDNKGSENLNNILSSERRKTIGGYFDQRLSRIDEKIGNESSYLHKVSKYAEDLPSNLYLVPGDPSLELQVQSINQISEIKIPVKRWAYVQSWLIDLQEGIINEFEGNDVTFFIDCNPSFATYTTQALVASNRLIVPCTADGSSARAIDNIASLLYGVNTPENYKSASFSTRANENNIKLPKIYSVVLNRSTTSSDKPAKAFESMYKNIQNKVRNLNDRKIDAIREGEGVFVNMPDSHTVAIVSSYFSKPINKIAVRQYKINDIGTMVNKDPLERYKKSLKEIVETL